MATDVLIVGAGPAGLALAAVLATHDVDFRIIDRRSGPTELSRAAIVHVRTLELFGHLGLAERAVARGLRTTRVEIHDRGRGVATFPLDGGATPFPYALALTQDRTERLLIEHLSEHGRSVEWNTELTTVVGGRNGAATTVRRPDGGEETVSARWVVGADGARSPVRHALGVGFTGSTFDQTGLLADVDLEFPAQRDVPAGTLRLTLTRGGFVGMLRLRGDRFRLFGAVPPGLTPPDGRDGISHDPYAAVSAADLQRWLDDHFAADARIRHPAWSALFRIHSRIAERFRLGAVFLIGDAAHIHSPAGGQGMNLAIGDAVNLGWKLALVARGHAHPALLDSYEAERRPVAASVLRGSDRGFAWETTSNPVARWVRTRIAGRLIGPLTRLRPVRAAISGLFAQTWIGYRHSPVVARARGRRPRPGDRAPQPLDPTAEPNIRDGFRHHVLIFERPGCSGVRRAAVQALVDRHPIEIRVHEIDAGERELRAHYRIRIPRVVLIRPDGHLSYRGTADDLSRFAEHLDGLFPRRVRP